MSRVQLALNVDDLDSAVAFYRNLFQAEPAKRRPGYANFAIADPALKLVLIENPGAGGTLNHLGVEVASSDEVVAETQRLVAAGLTTTVEDGTVCCYALQDKVWVGAEGAGNWEIYTVLADSQPELEGTSSSELAAAAAASPAATGCCGSAQAAEQPCCAG